MAVIGDRRFPFPPPVSVLSPTIPWRSQPFPESHGFQAFSIGSIPAPVSAVRLQSKTERTIFPYAPTARKRFAFSPAPVVPSAPPLFPRRPPCHTARNIVAVNAGKIPPSSHRQSPPMRTKGALPRQSADSNTKKETGLRPPSPPSLSTRSAPVRSTSSPRSPFTRPAFGKESSINPFCWHTGWRNREQSPF